MNQKRYSKLITSVLVILSILVSAGLLKFSLTPYFFIGLIWVALILFFSIRIRKKSLKLIGIYFSAVVLSFTAFEGYLWLNSIEYYISREVSPDYYRVDKYLGYAPHKDKKISEVKSYKDELIYNVTYTFDKNGLRISPPINDLDVEGCILFFGCSYTYGIGVEDHEAMPYQVGIKFQNKYRIYNFALSGYGPHQMLSALEHQIVTNTISCSGKIAAVYQAIPHHIERAAGLTYWDYHGPRYIADNNDNIKFAGNFDDVTLHRVILKYLNKSLIYRNFIGNRRFSDRINETNVYINIVKNSDYNFKKFFPDGEFHIIFWDNLFTFDDSPEQILLWKKTLKNLKDSGLNIHLVSNILPDYHNNRLKYDLSAYDIHPNAHTHQLIAEYISKNILNE